MNLTHVVGNEDFIRQHSESDAARCPHVWAERPWDGENPNTGVVCILCGVCGEIENSGRLYWPTD
jgi:hypothetical protein